MSSSFDNAPAGTSITGNQSDQSNMAANNTTTSPPSPDPPEVIRALARTIAESNPADLTKQHIDFLYEEDLSDALRLLQRQHAGRLPNAREVWVLRAPTQAIQVAQAAHFNAQPQTQQAREQCLARDRERERLRNIYTGEDSSDSS